MTNDKALRFFLMLFCIFSLSLIFTAFDMPFSDMNTTTYDWGFTVGATFGKMIKILVTLAIAKLVYVKMKAVSE